MSALPIEHGAIIELFILKRFEDLRTGYETMLDDKLEQHKLALDGRLDLQDDQIADVKGIVTESNTKITQLCEKHENWHDADILWRDRVKDDIAGLNQQMRAMKVFIAVCNGVVKTSRYIFENGDKAGGLTLKLILAGIVYLCGQNAYFHWLAPIVKVWLGKGH